MKKATLLILAAFAVGGCNRKDEPNKILDGYKGGTTEVVVPGDAARQFVLLQRDLLKVLVPVVNKLQNNKLPINELTNLSGGNYGFQTTESHYGFASYVLQFRDANNAVFDPVPQGNRLQAVSLLSLAITGTIASDEFPSTTENFVLKLSSPGALTSELRLTGSASFNGSGYALTFQFDVTGSKGTLEGLTDNVVTVTGTGGTPPATTAMNLAFNSDRSANGSISWEGREGSIHIEDNGSGFIVEPSGRTLLE